MTKKISNAEKYHFSDFTLENYLKLLKLARKRFAFCSYFNFNDHAKAIIWRHDVDFSPQHALKIAEIESKEGVKSTYFFLLHSEYYNFFDKEVFDIILKIKNLGHYIGLHFDHNFYDIKNENNLEEWLTFDKFILEKLLNLEIKVFSYHNPDECSRLWDRGDYAGMLNVYNDFFKEKTLYCSDSNGYWRYNRLEDVLMLDVSLLHVLTHPVWWTDKVMSPQERIYTCIDERCRNVKNIYDSILKISGRENIAN